MDATKIIQSDLIKYLFNFSGKTSSSININDPIAINIGTSENSCNSTIYPDKRKNPGTHIRILPQKTHGTRRKRQPGRLQILLMPVRQAVNQMLTGYFCHGLRLSDNSKNLSWASRSVPFPGCRARRNSAEWSSLPRKIATQPYARKKVQSCRSELTREVNTKMEIKLKTVMMLRQQTSGQPGFSG